jgi:serine/threonine protein kinase
MGNTNGKTAQPAASEEYDAPVAPVKSFNSFVSPSNTDPTNSVAASSVTASKPFSPSVNQPLPTSKILTSPTAAVNSNPAPAKKVQPTINEGHMVTPSLPVQMKARKAQLDDFQMLKTVGKGSFGKVVMVRKKDDNKIYAMKILKKDMILKRKQYEHTLAERRILENINHPFIVSLRYAFQSEHKLYMVFDFFNGGELYHYLSETGRFGEVRAKFYAAEIISALGYLHQLNIVYRDLKPENLILDSEGHIKITDFGLSKENVVGESITSICGTPEYLAPEILNKKPYGVVVDWWSLGTLLYEMICGLPPFYDKNRTTMYKKILAAPLEPPSYMSKEAVDICAKLLTREPTSRLGYNGADEIKAHPFFRDIDWKKLDKREISPPWVPTVSDPTDTRNIASEFINEPAGVTPSLTGSRLKDLTGSTPPSFSDFTFNGNSGGALLREASNGGGLYYDRDGVLSIGSQDSAAAADSSKKQSDEDIRHSLSGSQRSVANSNDSTSLGINQSSTSTPARPVGDSIDSDGSEIASMEGLRLS